MSENVGSRSGGLVAAFAIGAAIGAGIALLYAPTSGKDTRGMLAGKGRELRTRAKSALEDGKELVQEGRATLAGAVVEGKERLRERPVQHLTGT